MSSQRRVLRQTQPKTFKLSVDALLSLPYRLCNPPPAVGKVRSCGVTPIFQVQLEDILDRKHLPPLGENFQSLKDFEEWLMYVELCPENLYFLLWLKDYTEKYNQWSLQSKSRNGVRHAEYHITWPAQSCSQLALIYVRAKQTFFTPGSDYELNVPSDILSPFHTSNFGSPHPDPAVFAEVASEVQKMLKESLERFVVAAYTNVGNNRGWCGTVGGFSLMLLGAVPPIVYNFLTGRSRWLRLLALPGMWFGLTILLASLYGVCMMIYIFGDLRQLRKFELARPPISGPQPLVLTRRPPRTSLSVPPANRPPILPVSQPPRLPVITPPPPPHVAVRRDSCQTMSASSSHSRSSLTSSLDSSDGGAGEIHISPAYFDEVFVDDCESPAVIDPNYAFPAKASISLDHSRNTTASFAPTASFIHPYDHLYGDDEYDLAGDAPLPEQLQPLSSFDFDSLPPRSNSPPTVPVTVPNPPDTIVIQPDVPSKVRLTPKAIIAYVQAKCSIHKWQASIPMTDLEKSMPPGCKLPIAPDTNPQPHMHRRRNEKSAAQVHTQFKMVKAVPAFASPLTRVLSPVVARAQWEIVVRSGMVALLISWIILGSLLSIPVPKQ